MTAFGVPSHNSGQCARAATHSMSLLPWPDHQSPEKDTFADHTMEPSSNLSELHNLQINLEGQLAPQQGTLQWAAPDGLPRSSVNSCDAIPFPLDLHHNGNDISINQHHLWNDLGIASTMDELYAESCIHPPPFPSLDAAESGPSLYTTASNQLMVHKDVLDYSFQDTDDASEPDSEGGKGEPPYAKLIYDALMDAPEHQLVLRDIYTWISNNTDKAKDPAFKGWQNSVRHNLSMNGVSSHCLKSESAQLTSERLLERFLMLIQLISIRRAISGYWSPLQSVRELNLPQGTDKRPSGREEMKQWTQKDKSLAGKEAKLRGNLPNSEEQRNWGEGSGPNNILRSSPIRTFPLALH